MAKDYAKRVFTTSRSKKKRLRIELVIIPIFLILCVGGWLFAHKEIFSSETTFLAQVKSIFSHKTHKLASNKPNATVAPPQEEPLHFDFYNSLPTMKVTVPPVAVENSVNSAPAKIVKPHDPEANPHFIVQIGLFKELNEANQMRLSLLLSGCDADVVKINTKEGAQYRVQRGPFVTQAEAVKLQKEWEKKGVSATVKKG
jgi:cell division protein FtsN